MRQQRRCQMFQCVAADRTAAMITYITRVKEGVPKSPLKADLFQSFSMLTRFSVQRYQK
jgi:hypothetical protein